MKETGFVLVLVGMLVAMLLLVSIIRTPQAEVSSEATATLLGNGVVIGGNGVVIGNAWSACPGELAYCCVNENSGTVCGCYALCPANTTIIGP
jgi:hypothetical protein